jgi:hypothetical protein
MIQKAESIKIIKFRIVVLHLGALAIIAVREDGKRGATQQS